MPVSEVFNMDCLEYMKWLPDKYFELSVVDPPYGLGDRLSDGGGKLKDTPMASLYRESSKWDIKPEAEYFKELFRVSKNQIICGANYFLENLTSSRGVICWDKKQPMPTLSSWEFLWSSFDKPAKTFYGSSMDLNRFHPTQKPIALYKWLLQNYAKAGDKIFDSHMGSQSSRIAAWDMGFDYYGCELDKDYFDAGNKRFEQHKMQGGLFTPDEQYNIQDNIFTPTKDTKNKYL
jgi:site-specific DNA-methyltransferase (adenine-specific)